LVFLIHTVLNSVSFPHRYVELLKLGQHS